jgi:hypothetical protein
LDVVFVDLNIDILGTPPVCKGGMKMNKASHRTMCEEATKQQHLYVLTYLKLAMKDFHAKNWLKSLLSMIMKLSRFFSIESQSWEFRDSRLGVARQNDIWVMVPWPGIKYTIRGKVVASLESELW